MQKIRLKTKQKLLERRHYQQVEMGDNYGSPL